MHILHVVPTYLPATRYGGPIYSVHNLCRALVELGNEVEVITTNVDGMEDSDVPLGRAVELDGVKVWYFPSKTLRRLYYAPSMAPALLKMVKQFDLVHLHSIFLWPTWEAARAARKSKVPYIVSPRGMLVKDLVSRKNRLVKSLWLALIERKNLENAAAVHVTSQIEADEAVKFGYRLPEIVNIPNGVDIPARATLNVKREMLTDNNSYLLFLGRVNWKKGLDRLIPAMKQVPDIKLKIAGNDEEGYRSELEKLAREHGAFGQIEFLGPVTGDAKTELLANARVLVLPSYSENFGNVVLEAMAVGTPVVVTPEVGAAEVVRESGGGIVVDGAPDVLGPALAEILSNPERCREMGENGRKLVVEKYTWDAVAKQMEDAYRKVLAVG